MAISSLTSVITPVAGSTSQKWLIEPPSVLSWANLNPNFSPQFGQRIRMRETYEVSVIRNDQANFYFNANRFLPQINVGNWQILRTTIDTTYYVEKEAQAMADVESGLSDDIFTFTVFDEWDYNIYRAYQDYNGGVLSIIDACNADLEPAAVPNGFINEQNVLAYANILQSLYSGQVVTAIGQLADLADPTTAGFRFPDKKGLFTALTQQLVIDLNTLPLQPVIGSLGVCLHPGWSLLGASHTIECINYTKIAPLINQLEAPVCAYLPEFQYEFDQPLPLTCVELLAQEVAANSLFYTENDAINFNNANGGGGLPVQFQYICPNGSTLPGFVWGLSFT
jgi:hypothetical protein